MILLTDCQCVPESLSLKRAVVEELDHLAGPETIIASNSSSYTIAEILEGLKTKYSDRFVSLHSCKLLQRLQNLKHSLIRNFARLATGNLG